MKPIASGTAWRIIVSYQRRYRWHQPIILDVRFGNGVFCCSSRRSGCIRSLGVFLLGASDAMSLACSIPDGLDMLPEITEAEATGEVAAIYRRIRETQGSPVVNLIWRHLATIEGALSWAWPQVETGRPTIEAAMNPMFNFIDQCVARHSLAIGVSLTSPSPSAIDVLLAYDRGNCWNLLATTILVAVRAGSPLPSIGYEAAPLPPIRGAVPALRRYLELDARQRAQVDELSRVGPGAFSGVLPSLWLHLANWPDLLSEVAASCPPTLASTQFRAACDEVMERAAVILGLAPLRKAGPAPIDLSIGAFRQRLPEMLLIGRVLIKATGG
ncbi:hypothetical protein SAMN05444164_3283 [Bradyrhizobium erythrophlei]|uniref:Uncharacterized protein n=1 Tax=Bradyrhizobium erythrophlei TaxID=1437360 RepID=A0A1H4WX47_9BRAD|nr:hypothetical protein SAMN05444164_3283 [Bradyrhizobium erythrophlei]